MSAPRLSKYARSLDPELRRCGYELARKDGGHYVYTRDGWPIFVLPATPSDVRTHANDLARLKQRHPEMFERRKSENRPSKAQRQARSRRRSGRQPVALSLVAHSPERDVVEAVGVPAPGSPEAVSEGCECPRFENRHGIGVEGNDGIFAQVKTCPLHGWKDEPKVEIVVKRCPCGAPIHQASGPGRPRKYCESCRPSRWKRWTEEQRQREREYLAAWRRNNQREAA